MRYIYLGDRLTRPDLKGQPCDPVLRADGRVIRARNRNQLVRFASGALCIVAGRRLRVAEKVMAR